MVSTGWTKINLDPVISQRARKKKKQTKKTKQQKTTAKTKEAENRK